ncbi:DEAD-domain-containing protein [Clavulina sp. PMI_390]|nr:DEAD-domain-containing protein [Clavulina sp. PMI_390]
MASTSQAPRPLTPSLSGASFKSFADRGLLSAKTVASLPYELSTPIQEQTIEPGVKGLDILARAKTGTGKTVAFLLPAVERYITRANASSPTQVPILVLSPTRELAQQIGVEAQKISTGRGKLSVHCLVGGNNIKTEVSKLRGSRVDIVVVTPGRLIDHLENYGLAERFRTLQCLVLDEADRLLDQGFEPELQRILKMLPNRQTTPRQTLFFSATMPPKVQKLAATFLLPTHVNISTIAENEDSTHEHVPQEVAFVEPNDLYGAAVTLIDAAFKENPKAKIIAFFPTAREVGLFFEMYCALLQRVGRQDIIPFEIHSRKSQPQREKALAGFRTAEGSILFSSDVTARGIDVPDVSAVFQIGLPANGEQYVHRVGRTARAGKGGRAFLLLSSDQQIYMNTPDMKKLPILPASQDVLNNERIAPWKVLVDEVMRSPAVDNRAKGQAYQAWIGYNKGFLKTLRWTQVDLLRAANDYAFTLLRYEGEGDLAGKPPPMLAKTAGQIGIDRGNRHMLNIVQFLPDEEGKPRGGRGGGGGGRGGGGNANSRGGGRGGASNPVPSAQDSVSAPSVSAPVASASTGGGPARRGRGNRSRRGGGGGGGGGRGRGGASAPSS